MLRDLRIKDFAIIDRLEIRFDTGLTVLTGETGSGKSILVDALGLLLGGRASTGQIRTGCGEARVEGVFDHSPGGAVDQFLRGADLEGDQPGELFLRRLVSRNGRNRGYINGHLATQAQLLSLGNLLVDIHSQHEHQSLLRPDYQCFLLDDFGKLLPLREAFEKAHGKFRQIEEELSLLNEKERDRLQREDLLRFQAEEISGAALIPGEDAALEKERRILGNSERLAQLADRSYQGLYSDENGLLERIEEIGNSVEELAGLDDRLQDVSAGCLEAILQLKDAAFRLRDYRDGIEFDPKRLEELEARLHLIETLKRKYSGTIEGVIEIGEAARKEVEALAKNEERSRGLRETLKKNRMEMTRAAGKLTAARKKAAVNLRKSVEEELATLGMAKTRFEIRVEPTDDPDKYTASGADGIEIRVSSNPGEEPRPLARVASGGELSRIMLSLKTILTGVDRVRTLIFDEVDSGVGGVVAGVVGKRLKKLSRGRQVLCVTHLPQIASQADAHFTVSKKASGGRTRTGIRALESEERVDEVARMLGGTKATPTAFRHAREMLGQSGA